MTNLIPLTSIQVQANRQRREFDAGELNELREGIQARGLLHPVVVRREGDLVFLVAGERRLRAIQDMYDLGGTFSHAGKLVPEGFVPVTDVGELSELEAEEAELEENIRRSDLTWQERAEATSRLEALRSKQAAVAGLPPPTVGDIAKEVRNIPPSAVRESGAISGEPLTATKQELIVAKHLADPEVAAAPSLKEAMKILKKKEEQQRNSELATKIGQTFTHAAHRLENVDCINWMQEAEHGQFDLVLTDPPYGIGADEFGDSGQGVGAAEHFYDDSYESWLELITGKGWREGTTVTLHEGLPAYLFALAKPQAHAYLFCDIDRFEMLRDCMADAGWKVHRTPLIWHNPDGFRAPWPKMGPQRKYELILYAVKGDLPTTQVAPDVLTYRKDAALGHPAQKPVGLLRDLLQRSARPGFRVFDPFAGSGATLEACHGMKLACTALEKDKAAYGIAVKRLQGLETKQGELLK